MLSRSESGEPAAPELDLSACDREPIHIPGAIQPHGVLLVADRSGVIGRVAGDTARLLGMTPERLIGTAVTAVLPLEEPAIRRLAEGAARPQHQGTVQGRTGIELDLTAYPGAERLFFEIEPAGDQPNASQTLAFLQRVAHDFEGAINLTALCEAAAAAIREITGYARVMVYRFLEDGSGTVLAEARAAAMAPFLNHHFPASDIPRQARALYLRNPVRVIPDVSYRPAPLLPAEADAGGPVDLSDCALRSVSPIHIQYLKNMGVAASMSVSIVRDSELWGLIACHHPEPNLVPYHRRELCRHVGQLLSQHIRMRAETEAFAEGQRLQAARDALIASIGRAPSVEHWLADHLSELANVIPADGAAVVFPDNVRRVGRTPPQEALGQLADVLMRDRNFEVLATSALSTIFPRGADFTATGSGLLASLLSREDRIVMMWFRAERVETIEWAGNPHKSVEAAGPAGELTPRKSFEVWRETVRGRARPWSSAEVRAARQLRDVLLDLRQRERIVALNQELRRTLADKEELLAQKDLLMREANHRVQNSLQLVGSMLQLQGQRTALPEVRSALDEAQRRLAAVSIIHRRLWHSDQIEQVDMARYFAELRNELVQSWGNFWDGQIRMEVAPILVPTTLAVSLALILIELLTNAVKYAYDGEVGPVEISVRPQGAFHLQLVVADHGKGYRPSRTGGFGSRLVQGLVTRNDGRLDVADNGPGARVTVVLPMPEGAVESARTG